VLHIASNRGCGSGSVGVSQSVQFLDGVHADVLRSRGNGVSGFCDFGDAVGAGSAEDYDVEQGVGAETVGSVDRGGGGFSGGEEAGDNVVGLEGSVRSEFGADYLS